MVKRERRPAATDRVTIADIAARCGVSIGAVSFALNGRPGVSDATRDRIIQTAHEMNWRPHLAARALGGARAGVVGVVFNRPARTLGAEPFFGDLVAGLQSGLSGTQLGVTMLVARSMEEELETYRDWARRRAVDGVVLIDLRRDDPRPALLEALKLPAVVIGPHPSPPHRPASVWVDDWAATETLLGYLYALGHRRFAHVTGLADLEHTLLRCEAMERFAAEHALPRPRYEPTDYTAEAGRKATRRLLSGTPAPTAVIFDSDVLAVTGLAVAVEMGFEVPKSLSIASFDDSQMAQLVRPSLTTMTRDAVELGELSARLLEKQMTSPAPLASLQGPAIQLTVRESTAPISAEP